MHELLEQYFQKKDLEEQGKKEELLVKLGLCTESKGTSTDYTYRAMIDGRWEYMKRTPIEITDEEYEKLKKMYAQSRTSETSGFAVFLYLLAWNVYIGGAILGWHLLWEGSSETVGFVTWIVAFLAGTLFIGLGRAIKLLTKINHDLSFK